MDRSRPLDVFLPVAGGYDVIASGLRAEPSTWLPDPRPISGDCWRIDAAAGGLSRPVDCRVGPARGSSQSIWRSIEWTPVATDADVVPVQRALPTLDAVLGVAEHRGSVTMVLTGTYDVPAGLLGVVADVTALHRVARTTATAFLHDIRDSLTADRGESTPTGNQHTG